MEKPLTLVAAAALLDDYGRVLVQRRPAGRPLPGLWEFPGGKVERSEGIADALRRELHEELGVVIGDAEPFTFTTVPRPEGELLLLLHLVRDWHGEPLALHADELRWALPEALASLAMPDADEPFVRALIRRAAA